MITTYTTVTLESWESSIPKSTTWKTNLQTVNIKSFPFHLHLSAIFHIFRGFFERNLNWKSVNLFFFFLPQERQDALFLKFFSRSVTSRSVYFSCCSGILWEVKCLITCDWLNKVSNSPYRSLIQPATVLWKRTPTSDLTK